MSTTLKVMLVRAALPEGGLQAALDVVGLPRATWYYYHRRQRNYQQQYRRPASTPGGHRPNPSRVRLSSRDRRAQGDLGIRSQPQGRPAATALVGLAVATQNPASASERDPTAILSAGRHANLIVDKADIEPFAVLYADFTELRYAGGQQKGYLITLIDHATKVVVGWAVGNRKTTEVALQAWERAKRTLTTCAGSWQGMIVPHDQDPVFVEYQWTSTLLLEDGVRVSTRFEGPAGTPRWKPSSAGSKRRTDRCCWIARRSRSARA